MIMKNEFTSKDNVAVAILAIAVFAILGAMLVSNHAQATPAPLVQKMDTIVVTAQRPKVEMMETIVVSAARSTTQL
jgi:hypothetical protein